jgi:hypothetical protein
MSSTGKGPVGSHVRALLIGAAAAAIACSTALKKDVAQTALDGMNEEQRRSTLEAALRVFDEKPQYVDELYDLIRKQHPRTLDEFVANSARDLQHHDMARLAALALVREPASVEENLATSIEAIAHVPAARAAMRRAIVRRANETVDILSDDPAAMTALLDAALRTIEEKPEARKGALAAVRRESGRIVDVVERDPELFRDMTGAVVGRALKQR